MIATGGLLRINARRQDSLRSKPHRPHPHKKKSKDKRRSEVVVVKGKLKLCSIPGLVAVLGVLVLLVGVLMAALGYWPRDGLFFSSSPQEGAAVALMAVSSPAPPPAGVQEEHRWEEPDGGSGSDVGGRAEPGLNRTDAINGTAQDVPPGFLEDFLDRWLYSDRLKVLGPLIMGIGIFLFICANAVLHENRDKKTKVINLRDIYSTVIDLHSVRKPRPSFSGSAPLNGLINYVQSKSLDSRSRPCPAALLSSRQPPTDGGGGAVFSIYRETPPPQAPPPDRRALPQASLHQEALSSFTLPRPRQRSPAPRRRHSVWAGSRRSEGADPATDNPPPPPPPPPPHRDSRALLLLSSSSLSSLSHLLSSSSSTPAPPCRRRSLPTAAYSRLTPKDEDPGAELKLGSEDGEEPN